MGFSGGLKCLLLLVNGNMVSGIGLVYVDKITPLIPGRFSCYFSDTLHSMDQIGHWPDVAGIEAMFIELQHFDLAKI